MTGEDDIRRRRYDAAGQADLILVEGVMGLYDGEPSAAEMAHRVLTMGDGRIVAEKVNEQRLKADELRW